MYLVVSLFLLGLTASTCAGAALPEKVIMGYQSWSACDANRTITEVQKGVNVVVWFAINLVKGSNGPYISGGPDPQCMASVAKQLDVMGFKATHLISIGGWDAPHPDGTYGGQEWFRIWNEWNKLLPRPYDGFDWDLEGNDNQASVYNKFTQTTLDIVVDMSAQGKRGGYIVTLVPPQSYFDSTTSDFNLSLLNYYPNYHSDFHYHSMNVYAYFLAASHVYPSGGFAFDVVSIQLYESWSRADYYINEVKVPAPAYLYNLTRTLQNGWKVDFGHKAGALVTGKHLIKLHANQTVIALSFGDTAGKVVFVQPSDAGIAYNEENEERRPRGYAFWCIAGETPGGETNFASELNKFMHIRP